MKAVTLCALSRQSRLAELASLYLHSLVFSLRVHSFASFTTQGQPGRAIKEYFIPQFEENSNICPTVTLQRYCDKTSDSQSLKNVKADLAIYIN